MKTTRTNKLLAVLMSTIMVICVMSSTALAATASGKCGKNLTWSYDKSSKTLTISGKGAMYDYYIDEYEDDSPPWADYDGFTVVIKKGVTSIGKNAFTDQHIKKVSFPDTLKSIGVCAFGGGLGSELNGTVTIPKSVTKIGDSAFLSDGIKSFKVAKENKKYASVDGVLFNKAKTVLIACPSGKKGTYTIPKGTKTISGYAFNRGGNLKKLVVPASVKKIEEGAFMWSELKAVYFKGSAPKNLVFDEEDYIGTVYYPKSKESSWKKVKEKSKKWDFDGKWKTWNP